MLIPKKWEVEDLKNFRPISLVGGLYKWLAKMLANRMMRVLAKVILMSQNAFLLHCIVVKVLWEIVLALTGIQWVFPETIKKVLFSWRSPFVGKKRKKIWNSIPLCIF